MQFYRTGICCVFNSVGNQNSYSEDMYLILILAGQNKKQAEINKEVIAVIQIKDHQKKSAKPDHLFMTRLHSRQ